MATSSPVLPAKETTVPAGTNLMFDPSSLLDRTALREISDLFREVPNLGVPYLPATLFRALNEPHLMPTIERYFGRRGQEISATDVLQLIRSAGIRPYPEGQMVLRGEDEVVLRLMRTRDRVIRDVLLEEWSFLTGRSWIAARSKRPFDAFKRAGAVVVEFGGKKFDRLAAATLHHDRLAIPRTLNHRDRIRAAAKWVAAGGPPVVGLLDPLLGVIAGSGSAMFLLLDP